MTRSCSWTTLTSLDLSSNYIGDEGATALKKKWPNISLNY